MSDSEPRATEESQSDSEGSDLTEVLDDVVEEAEGERITLKEILQTFGARSFGPLILFLAFVAVSPIGMIPGMSMITGALLMIVCGQLLCFRTYPWLPAKLTSKEFSREKLTKTMEKARPWALKLDRILKERLVFLSEIPLLQVSALICFLLAITFFPLAFVPFGVLAPGLAILIFGLGLTVRDGFVLLLAFALTAAAVWVMLLLWPDDFSFANLWPF